MYNKILPYDMAQFIHLKLRYPIFDTANKSGYYHRRTKNYIHFGRIGLCRESHLYGAPTAGVFLAWMLKRKDGMYSSLSKGSSDDAQDDVIISTIYNREMNVLSTKIVGDTTTDFDTAFMESLWHLINFCQ